MTRSMKVASKLNALAEALSSIAPDWLAVEEGLTISAVVTLLSLHISDAQKGAAVTLLGVAYLAFRGVVKTLNRKPAV